MPTDKSDQEQELIDFINRALDVQSTRPAEDIGIDIGPPRTKGTHVSNFPVEEIPPVPEPPGPHYCICGIKFATFAELLAHRHPAPKKLLPDGKEMKDYQPPDRAHWDRTLPHWATHPTDFLSDAEIKSLLKLNKARKLRRRQSLVTWENNHTNATKKP